MKKLLSLIFLLVLANQFVSGQEVKAEILGSKNTLNRLVTKPFWEIPKEVPKEVSGFHAKGTISILLWIDDSGNVQKLKMLGGFSNVKFMKEFITKEASSWKFRPLKRNGKQVPFKGLVAIPFCYGSFTECW